MKKIKINNINCFAPSSRIELIEYAFINNSILIAVNAEKILNSNKKTQDIINRNIGYPDGIGAVWALKKNGVNNVIKIPGCELWLDIIKFSYPQKKFYLIGGKEEIILKTIEKLNFDFPGIEIVGFRNGYLKTKEEKEDLLVDIIDKKPDVVFVAMGSPKQELLMEELSTKHSAVYQGLGGSFDVYVGNVKRAPNWWVDNNLEWAYRLIKQPSRIKRQIYLIKFLFMLKFNRF